MKMLEEYNEFSLKQDEITALLKVLAHRINQDVDRWQLSHYVPLSGYNYENEWEPDTISQEMEFQLLVGKRIAELSVTDVFTYQGRRIAREYEFTWYTLDHKIVYSDSWDDDIAFGDDDKYRCLFSNRIINRIMHKGKVWKVSPLLYSEDRLWELDSILKENPQCNRTFFLTMLRLVEHGCIDRIHNANGDWLANFVLAE